VPEVREAVERQIASGIMHTSTLYLIRSQVELAEKIARLSGIPDAKVFFTNSGPRPTRRRCCWHRRPPRRPGARLRNSYHGRSFGAVAVTGNAGWKQSSLAPFGGALPARYGPAAARLRGYADGAYIEACVADLRNVLATAARPA